jgi:hypothetical protein
VSDDAHPSHSVGSDLRTIFSVDGSRYLAWQAEFLAYTFERAQQPGLLTRLWSGHGVPEPFRGETFQTPPYSPHPVSGDEYVCYNRQFALDDWLWATPERDETILLVDPDFVFLNPVSHGVQQGHPIAHPTGYVDPKRHAVLVERHCRRPDDVQSLGWPVIIHRSDLTTITPLWIAKTEAIRNDPVVRDDAGWITDMWGYVFAAAELGMVHQTEYLAATQMDRRDDTPFIHYCYESQSASGTWRWEKRWYEPADPIPDPPDDVPLASQALIALLNEWLIKRAAADPSDHLAPGYERALTVPA